MINLTLNKLKRPALQNLVPKFGTKVEKNDINKGGLSTAEVDLNMTLPFELMREIEVSSSDTTTKIQYDAKIAIVGSDPVTLTLDQATYKGCTITIKNRNSEQATIVLSEDNQKNIGPNKSLVLEWDGTTWIDTTLIIDSTISEDSHNPISSAAVYQKANEITQTVTNETNARNEAIVEERRLREEANTAIEQQINGEMEDRKNSDSFLFNKIKSTNNIIGQLESLKTTDKSSAVAAINEVYDSVQQGGGTSNTAANCEQFTFVVDSNEALAEWANNVEGNDYTSVLIRKGEWTSTIGVNLKTSGTIKVLGEAGNKLIFTDVNQCITGHADMDIISGVEIESLINDTNILYDICGFFSIRKAIYCKATIIINNINAMTGAAFSNCYDLDKCIGSCIGSSDENAEKGAFNGFDYCKRVNGCAGYGVSKGTGYGFNNCTGVTYCRSNGNSTTNIYNISYSTQYDTSSTYACNDTPEGGFNSTLPFKTD